MKYIAALVLVFLCFIWHQDVAAIDPIFLKTYDEKVCNNEPTCNLTDTPGLLSNRLTFEGRDCMCDFECVEYNDCCKDSNYYTTTPSTTSGKTYYCAPQSKIYMVVSCPSTYSNAETKELCAKATLPLDQDNTIIIRPVTDQNNRVTYANAYCAECNGVSDFEPWSLTAGCGEAPVGYVTSTPTAKSSTNTVQNKISVSSSSTTTPKPDKSLNLDIHFNPGSLFGGNKSADAGFNKEVKIPTFGLGNTNVINKTLGSTTGLFGINIKRNKRVAELNLDFTKYASQVNEIIKTAKFDSNLKQFVAKYDGKDFICEYGTKMPDNFDSYVRICVPNLISKCPADSEATQLCQSYTAVVYNTSNKQPYRNKDCAVCNGISLSTITGCPTAVRSSASESLFNVDGKASGGIPCDDPVIAAKFC